MIGRIVPPRKNHWEGLAGQEQPHLGLARMKREKHAPGRGVRAALEFRV